MKRRLLYIIMCVAFAATAVTGCSDTSGNLWDEMPEPITKFISCYFPNVAISKFVETDNHYFVTIKDGPAIVFDDTYQWLSIDGQGETLPQMLLFDDLPPTLYSYLQENEAVNSVYSVSRSDSTYQLKLADSVIDYDTSTGIVSYEE